MSRSVQLRLLVGARGGYIMALCVCDCVCPVVATRLQVPGRAPSRHVRHVGLTKGRLAAAWHPTPWYYLYPSLSRWVADLLL